MAEAQVKNRERRQQRKNQRYRGGKPTFRVNTRIFESLWLLKSSKEVKEGNKIIRKLN